MAIQGLMAGKHYSLLMPWFPGATALLPKSGNGELE
jgi:hypothetical protein